MKMLQPELVVDAEINFICSPARKISQFIAFSQPKNPKAIILREYKWLLFIGKAFILRGD